MKTNPPNGNPPDLRLVVTQLSARLDRIETMLQRYTPHAPASKIATVQATVAQSYGLEIADLTGPRRTAEVALARQIAMTLAYGINPSLTRIAEAFNRKHGTVMHAISAVGNRRQTDRKFKDEFAFVSESVAKALRDLQAA